jgi:hypothetical protein
MMQKLLKCVVKPSLYVVKYPVLLRGQISDCRASIIHCRLCHHCTTGESPSLIDYAYQECKNALSRTGLCLEHNRVKINTRT